MLLHMRSGLSDRPRAHNHKYQLCHTGTEAHANASSIRIRLYLLGPESFERFQESSFFLWGPMLPRRSLASLAFVGSTEAWARTGASEDSESLVLPPSSLCKTTSCASGFSVRARVGAVMSVHRPTARRTLTIFFHLEPVA